MSGRKSGWEVEGEAKYLAGGNRTTGFVPSTFGIAVDLFNHTTLFQPGKNYTRRLIGLQLISMDWISRISKPFVSNLKSLETFFDS